MGQLFNTIRQLVVQEKYALSIHVLERLRERKIVQWQVIDGITQAVLLSERPNTLPNPTVELQQQLADGATIKVVWALLSNQQAALLVTVHF
jgi:hypothetical protein